MLEKTWEFGMSTAVMGPLGVGKTFGVTALLNQLARERRLQPSAGATPPQRWTSVTMKADSSAKSLLVGLYSALTGSSSGMNSVKAHSQTQLNQRVVDHVMQQHVRVLVLDEAQTLSVSLLDTLIHLPDNVPDGTAPFGIVLIGTPELHLKIEQTGQLGQRVVFEHEMLPLQRIDMDAVLSVLAPVLTSLQQQKQWEVPGGGHHSWKQLCDKVFAHCDGTWRPLLNLTRLITSYVAQGCAPEEAVRTALGMLVPANRNRR